MNYNVYIYIYISINIHMMQFLWHDHGSDGKYTMIEDDRH